jgi:glutamate-ammonia-ligase adenylyltransferase
MALTRARVVAGPPALRARVQAAIAAALAEAGEPGGVRADAAAMRARLARELPPEEPWDVKHRLGGQMEVEFIAQALQLLHARVHPELCSQTTRIALARLAGAGLLAEEDRRLLIRADHLWRTVQGMLRITAGRNAPENLPEASARPLLEATGAVDLGSLRATIDATGRDVRAAFIRHVGEIGT